MGHLTNSQLRRLKILSSHKRKGFKLSVQELRMYSFLRLFNKLDNHAKRQNNKL